MDNAAVDRAAPDVLERPTGRFDRVPSRVTGRTLTYFSPDPFPALLDRYSASSCRWNVRKTASTTDHRSAPEALVLVRGALGFRSPQSRGEEARAFINVLSTRAAIGLDRGSLMSLGTSASHAPRRLRREVAFSGARIASDGHIFAHDEDVDGLFESLCEGLSAPPASIPVTVLVACAAFHALHVHPFADGNGRWARLLVASVGSAMGELATGVTHACLLQLGKSLLVEREWPRARSCGLGAYVARCLAFERRVLEGLASRALPDAMTALHAGINAAVSSPNVRADLLADLIAQGRVKRSEIKRVASLSSRALDGALVRMAERGGCEVDDATGDLDAHALMKQVDDVLCTALRATFHD